MTASMLNFDFTNYTFSGLLSILASLYGVGYPLIIQSIGRIYSQYDSAQLSQRFLREPTYKVFQLLLIANLVVAVVIPFLLLPNGWNKLLITFQALMLVWLIGQTFLLFRMILTYSNAGALLEHIAAKQVDKDNVMEIFDIAIYADSKHNVHLYIDALSYVGTYISVQQGGKTGMDIHDVLPAPIYDETTQNIIFKIKEYLRDDDEYHYLHRNNDIVSILYNQASASRLGLQAHKWMWMLLNEAITYDNHSWFSQYWQFADSYSAMKYHYAYDDDLRQDRKDFLLRHVMIGTLLVHNERFRWLNDIFFYTHSEPEYYGLIPSSFTDIIMMLRKLDIVCQVPLFQHYGFYFADEMGGVKDEKFIFREAVRYLSLLVIRLWSLDGRSSLNHAEKLSKPTTPINIKECEREEQLMEMMKGDVAEWFGLNVFDKIPRLKMVKESEVQKLLEDYKGQCETDRIMHEQHPDVSRKKFETLKNSLEESIGDLKFILPKENSMMKSDKVTMTTIASNTTRLETLHFSDYMKIGTSGMSDMMTENFGFKVYRAYEEVICKRMKRLRTFKIKGNQIAAFITGIGLQPDFVIVAGGEIERLEGVHVQLESCYWPKRFYILKRDDLPFVKLGPTTGNNYMPLKSGSVYCSNIDEFLQCRKPTFDCVLATSITVTMPKQESGVVMVVVENGFDEQPLEMTENLKDIFKGEEAN